MDEIGGWNYYWDSSDSTSKDRSMSGSRSMSKVETGVPPNILNSP